MTQIGNRHSTDVSEHNQSTPVRERRISQQEWQQSVEIAARDALRTQPKHEGLGLTDGDAAETTWDNTDVRKECADTHLWRRLNKLQHEQHALGRGSTSDTCENQLGWRLKRAGILNEVWCSLDLPQFLTFERFKTSTLALARRAGLTDEGEFSIVGGWKFAAALCLINEFGLRDEHLLCLSTGDEPDTKEYATTLLRRVMEMALPDVERPNARAKWVRLLAEVSGRLDL